MVGSTAAAAKEKKNFFTIEMFFLSRFSYSLIYVYKPFEDVSQSFQEYRLFLIYDYEHSKIIKNFNRKKSFIFPYICCSIIKNQIF
jgi:hypothetical protein